MFREIARAMELLEELVEIARNLLTRVNKIERDQACVLKSLDAIEDKLPAGGFPNDR